MGRCSAICADEKKTCSCFCEPWAACPQSLWRSRRTCDVEPWQPALRVAKKWAWLRHSARRTCIRKNTRRQLAFYRFFSFLLLTFLLLSSLLFSAFCFSSLSICLSFLIAGQERFSLPCNAFVWRPVSKNCIDRQARHSQSPQKMPVSRKARGGAVAVWF